VIPPQRAPRAQRPQGWIRIKTAKAPPHRPCLVTTPSNELSQPRLNAFLSLGALWVLCGEPSWRDNPVSNRGIGFVSAFTIPCHPGRPRNLGSDSGQVASPRGGWKAAEGCRTPHQRPAPAEAAIGPSGRSHQDRTGGVSIGTRTRRIDHHPVVDADGVWAGRFQEPREQVIQWPIYRRRLEDRRCRSPLLRAVRMELGTSL
jgi:hypothetical protein